jgi:hypothetical protein
VTESTAAARVFEARRVAPQHVVDVGRQLDLRGYVLGSRWGVVALVENNPGKLFHLRTRIRQLEEGQNVAGGNFSNLPPLRLVENTKRISVSQGSIDIFNLAGELQGWVYSPKGYVDVRIFVDGEEAGTLRANRFREDLLKAGIGFGAHSFAWPLPARFMDGREHEIALSFDGKTISKTMQVPYLAAIDRAWLGYSRPVRDWTEADEAAFRQARLEIMQGDRERGYGHARDLVDAQPGAIFRDLGVQERHLAEQRRMPSFRDRLDRRWGDLFDSGLCERGAGCCKATSLAYNPPVPSRIPNWPPQDLFERCPRPIRHLASKELTKLYAERLNLPVARHLFDIASAQDLHRLADAPERFVLKPDFESGSKGVFLMHRGINLFGGRRYGTGELERWVAEYLASRPKARFAVEEFLIQEGAAADAPVVPLDYKLHCFGGKVRIVQVVDRNPQYRNPPNSQIWYARDWTEAPFRMRVAEQQNAPIRRPDCYDEMLRIADRIAKDLGDYIRVDLYATDRGAVLGELTSYSNSGTGFTEFASVIMSQAWEIFGETAQP